MYGTTSMEGGKRQFDFFKNRMLYREVCELYGKDFTATKDDAKQLLNKRTTVTYQPMFVGREIDDPDPKKRVVVYDLVKNTYIAVWYPRKRIQPIAVENLNKMLTELITDDRDTKRDEDDEYVEYDKLRKHPMTVVHHEYDDDGDDDDKHVDIEISFNFPTTYSPEDLLNKNTVTYDKNRVITRFLGNFRDFMTNNKEPFTDTTYDVFHAKILKHQCAVKRSAMTQSGSTCFLNAAFNVFRLSPELSKLIQDKIPTIHSKDTDYYPEKCGEDSYCFKTMNFMADSRNKRRHIQSHNCTYIPATGPNIFSFEKVIHDILYLYAISHKILDLAYMRDNKIDIVLDEDEYVVTTRVTPLAYNLVDRASLFYKPPGYTLVASLIRTANHGVCGYFCEKGGIREPRVFDSNGFDIDYNWNVKTIQEVSDVVSKVFVQFNGYRKSTPYKTCDATAVDAATTNNEKMPNCDIIFVYVNNKRL